MTAAERNVTGEEALPEPPIFSERLTTVLVDIIKGEAPNAGRFCGNCYTPIDKQRSVCPQCDCSVEERPPVGKIPREVGVMFRNLRGRESLVVNSYAYAGLFLGVIIFIAVFYVLFTLGAGIWWFIGDLVLLAVSARVLAGLLGGYIGDEVGYRYARRKLAEDWAAWEATGRKEEEPG